MQNRKVNSVFCFSAANCPIRVREKKNSEKCQQAVDNIVNDITSKKNVHLICIDLNFMFN